ncbi:hypothetical protein THAOC_13634 [Thalassiosira oceanica]|uniref:16S rRNA (uracil(1498)-N(3))-methyltransferase n=1 Tax=Thalassiosira oceanica TaxID=159749 RepID=K0SJH0_THAOC|nr:hypothetical protein THAOC_13634 [Thalassiosira oceanica]|eukprot:EJK65495.1 hypothetical protein THAOC_13634 [Thalassiosira oceanica]
MAMAGRAIISWLVGTSSNDLGFISKSCKARSMHRSSNLFLNRIMFDATELSVVSDQSKGYLATVTLPKDDYRTRHIAKTLNLQNGDCVRAGCVRDRDPSEFDSLGGLMTDEAFVEWLPEGKIKKASPTRNREPPGSLKVLIPNPPKTSLWEDRYGAETDDTPRVSLLLALPRPLQLQRWGLFIQCENSLEFWSLLTNFRIRLLPMVAQLGVENLILTNARKVPKDYFGSHLFRKPSVLRGLLVEGLSQSGDVRLPRVTVSKRLKIFLEDELDELFPRSQYERIIAHPQRKDETGRMTRMSDIKVNATDGSPRRILLAVGPEGGWEEPYELDMFQKLGFKRITLGTRVLRTDVAVVSLLALANEACSSL